MRNVFIFDMGLKFTNNNFGIGDCDSEVKKQVKTNAYNEFKNVGFNDCRADEYSNPEFAMNYFHDLYTNLKNQFWLINWDEYNADNGANRKDGFFINSKNDDELYPERRRFAAFNKKQAEYELNKIEGKTHGTDYIAYLVNMPERFNKLFQKYTQLQTDFKDMIKNDDDLIEVLNNDYKYDLKEISILGIDADSPRIKRKWSFTEKYSKKFGKRTANKINKIREQGYILFCKMNMIIYKMVKKQGLKKVINEHVRVLVKCEYHS